MTVPLPGHLLVILPGPAITSNTGTEAAACRAVSLMAAKPVVLVVATAFCTVEDLHVLLTRHLALVDEKVLAPGDSHPPVSKLSVRLVTLELLFELAVPARMLRPAS